nr:hypothetical protein [Tanacetum cinerariifolium]
MWPVILTTYNLPPWLCIKESSFMLTLLIPGPKSSGKDIYVYMRSLIDDLKDLWAKPGVKTIDVVTGQKFNMRAMVLWSINDFPARSSLSGWSGQDPPREFSWDAIMTKLARLPTRVKGKHPRFGGVKIKGNVLVELNWTKRSIFYELEDWSFQTLKHNLDVMHIEKNVLESILNTLLNNDKSKETAKARQDLKIPGIQSGLWLGQNKNDDMLKAQSKVIDILCNLDLIYPPAFFDIMIHLVIYLPLEAIFDGPIRPWWMYPFERYMKKLKNYVQNKAKWEGSIAKGYVAEEALTFNNDPGVNKSSELFALACEPSQTPISVNSCVVNDVRRPLGWKVVEQVSHKKFLNEGVIVVEYDPHVIHVDNSSDLTLSTSLNDMEITGLHIDGQSIDVDAPPDIIDVVDEDDDITDEEAPIPYDLVDFDDEDLISADVAWGHGDDRGVDDRPPSYYVPTGCEGFLGNRGKGTRKPNLGGRRAGRLHTRQETQNLRLKAIMDKSGPVLIRFEVDGRETLKPLGDHAAHWANYLGELVRELPLHYPSWRQMPPERKAGVVAKIWFAFWNDPKNLTWGAQNKRNRAKSKVVYRQGSRSIVALRDMH